MLTLRSLHWPDDRQPLLALNASFTTGRVYRVVQTPSGFEMQEGVADPPLHKTNDFAREVDRFPELDFVLIAESERRLAGVAALSDDSENRRALLMHFYVDLAFRKQGIGRALMQDVIAHARGWQARCLWLGTQDVNYAAIQFYRKAGFTWCGLGLSLDELHGSTREKTAVFFMRTLELL